METIEAKDEGEDKGDGKAVIINPHFRWPLNPFLGHTCVEIVLDM